jgi:hypothetical protein
MAIDRGLLGAGGLVMRRVWHTGLELGKGEGSMHIAVMARSYGGVEAMPPWSIQVRTAGHRRPVTVVVLMVHGRVSVRKAPKDSRSRSRPMRMRVLTVPRGCPRWAAISV